MKRVSRILICLLPLLITVMLQNLVSIPLCGVTAVATILKDYHAGFPFAEIYQDILALWSSGPFMIWLSAIYAAAAIAIFGFWYQKKLAKDQEQVPVSSAFNKWIILAIFLLAIGLQYAVTYLMSFIGALRPDWMQVYEDLMDTAGIGSLSPVTVIYACAIAPVSEELIFRGVTLGYAKKAMPAMAAVCLQAVLFGVFHMNMIQGIYAAVLGLFLGYVREAGGTVAIPMLLHAIFNVCGTFLNPYMYYRIEQPFFFLLWLTVGVLLTYAGIFLFQHGLADRILPETGTPGSPIAGISQNSIRTEELSRTDS